MYRYCWRTVGCGIRTISRRNVTKVALLLLGCSVALGASTASRVGVALANTPLPAVPRAFRLRLGEGWVMHVLALRRWQVVDVELVRHDKGKARGIYYSVGSESGKGIVDPWPNLSAEIEPGAISAHMGPLVSIDVHFVPVDGSHPYEPKCGGHAVRFGRGYFEGSVRLSGGNGYPSLDATTAQADPEMELQSKCTGGWVAEGPPTLPGAELLADSVQSSTPYFEAFKVNPHARSTIGVGINESDRGVSVSRFVQVLAPAEAFQYSHSLERAIVRPPAPFSGSGFYSAARDRRHRWSGNLSVDFPGRAGVSLTQPPLHGFINPARWVPPRPKKVR